MTGSTEGSFLKVYLDDCRVSDCFNFLHTQGLKGHLWIAHDLGCSSDYSRLCFLYPAHKNISAASLLSSFERLCLACGVCNCVCYLDYRIHDVSLI